MINLDENKILPDGLHDIVGKMQEIITDKSLEEVCKEIVKNEFMDAVDDPQTSEDLKRTKEQIDKAKEVLSDPDRTTFKMVVIPEEMSIYESERALEALGKYDITVDSVIVNQVMPDICDCDFCHSRHKLQQKRLALIDQKFPDQHIAEVPLFKDEVKGQEKLLKETDEKEFKTIYAINKFACEQYLEMYERVFALKYCKAFSIL